MLTQTLQPLPDDVMMTMKLYYYDDGESRSMVRGRVRGSDHCCFPTQSPLRIMSLLVSSPLVQKTLSLRSLLSTSG